MIVSARMRIVVSFWLLGLINNVLYVIILSAALDLVGPTVPKGLVLLANILPSFIVKLTAPYFFHLIAYSTRVITFVALSATGMIIIALTGEATDPSSIMLKLFGIALASLSSGGGESSYLGLTHFFGYVSLASWSSGTGAAGLLGAGAYAVATTTLGFSSRTSLIAFSFLPATTLVTFFLILPRDMITLHSSAASGLTDYLSIPTEDGRETPPPELDSIIHDTHAQPSTADHTIWLQFKANLKRAQSLFIPYMLPLMLVYIAEYTINQGVSPTLLFPLASSPFEAFRDFYPAYNAIYQLGVFISRSSYPWLRIHSLYAPSFLQVLNLVLLTLHALFDFLPSVWVVFVIVLWEGLLGGLVYVNTFAEISDNVSIEDREFSLSATSVSDSAGTFIAALLSMAFEKSLCNWQVNHLHRDWCRRR